MRLCVGGAGGGRREGGARLEIAIDEGKHGEQLAYLRADLRAARNALDSELQCSIDLATTYAAARDT